MISVPKRMEALIREDSGMVTQGEFRMPKLSVPTEKMIFYGFPCPKCGEDGARRAVLFNDDSRTVTLRCSCGEVWESKCMKIEMKELFRGLYPKE
jgi:hypothetical protein